MKHLERMAVLMAVFMGGTATTVTAQDVTRPWDILFRYGISLLINDPVEARRNPTGILRCTIADGGSVDITYMRMFSPTAPGGFNQALATCRALQQRWQAEHPIQPITVTPVIVNPPAPPPGNNTGDTPRGGSTTSQPAASTSASPEEFRARVCQAYLSHRPPISQGSIRFKGGLLGGALTPPAHFGEASGRYALTVSTVLGAVSWTLLKLGVPLATRAGTSGFTLFTLTKKAHTAEKWMTRAEGILWATGSHSPESEPQWVPWTDVTGCTP